MSDAIPTIQLQSGHDRRTAGGHPWAYSNELKLDPAAKALEPGTLVRLARGDSKPLGIASFNRNTLIAARLILRDAGATPADVNQAFLEARLRAALALRERLLPAPCYRLLHSEGDGLPGFIADRFGDVIVLQANTAGAERLTPLMLDAIEAVLSPAAIVLRNDSSYRELEGLKKEIRLARGTLPAQVEVREHDVRHVVEPLDGQKTGWFFDLYEARGLMARLASGGTMLDLCCNTGAFSLAALTAGARHALLVDRSESSLASAGASARLNGLDDRIETRRGDLFDEADRLLQAGRRFDVVIADPPSFAKARRDVPQALRAYRKLARQAASLTASGGFLFIASCSHNIETEAFGQEVARGIASAEREGRIIAQGGAGPDHPIHPQLAETGYLKWQVLALD